MQEMHPRLRALFTTTLFILTLALAFARSDSPFPESKKNHWVYAAMIQIKKNHLWYRMNDNVPKRNPQTRQDFATKTLFLAVDSENTVESFRLTTGMVSKPAYDARTKKWATDFKSTFPKRKLVYQNYINRIIRLWSFFKPEIKIVAKKYKADVNIISHNLKEEKTALDGLKIK